LIVERFGPGPATTFAFGQGDRPVEASTRKLTSAQSDADPSHAGELRHKGSPGFLALTAIGVVFGDIGTSPLYTLSVTLSATGHTSPTPVHVLAIISLTFC